MRAWITNMGRRSSIARVVHLMCELYVRARNIGLVFGTQLVLPLSQSMLADSLGMTHVHLNRALKALRLATAVNSAAARNDCRQFRSGVSARWPRELEKSVGRIGGAP